MKTFVKTTAVHKTTCKFVNDDNFAVLDNIVNIKLHNAVGLDSLIYMVLNCKVIGIGKVFNTEKFFGFLNTALCEGCCFLLFINNIINVVFLVIFLHILFCVKFCKTLNFKSFCKSVSLCVKVC